MARKAREISNNKVYHVMLRGVNKQQIFECEEDYAHLLIKEADEAIGDVMKRIYSSYVYYYNRKYDRVGHLFQERFKSQPVEDWEYFVTLLRYVHQNPLKPRLVKDLKEYQWSSWNEYLGRFENPFSTIEPVLRRISLEELSELIGKPMTEEEEEGVLDIDNQQQKTQLSDEEVWRILEECSGVRNASEFQALPRPKQKHYLYMAHENGVGPRTLSRLTGVSYSVVYKATSGAKEQWDLMHGEPSDMMRELSPEEELWMTYCDEGEFEKCPDY